MKRSQALLGLIVIPGAMFWSGCPTRTLPDSEPPVTNTICIFQPPGVPTKPTEDGWMVTDHLLDPACPVVMGMMRKNAKEWTQLSSIPTRSSNFSNNKLEVCAPAEFTGLFPTNIVLTGLRKADAPGTSGKCFDPPIQTIAEITRIDSTNSFDGYQKGDFLLVCTGGGLWSNTPPDWKDVGPSTSNRCLNPPNNAKIIEKES